MPSGKIIKDFLHKDIIDIQLLLCLALKQKKEQLFANPSYELTKKELNKLDRYSPSKKLRPGELDFCAHPNSPCASISTPQRAAQGPT